MELGKIKDLLAKCNVSTELQNGILEALVEWRSTVKESYAQAYDKKLEKAKSLCEAEVAKYKQDLAQKVQVFCESKVSQIENVVAKQAQNQETEAAGKLTRIKSMLEGVELKNGQQVSELKAQNAKLQKIAAQLHEDNNRIKKQAERQLEVTGKIVKRSKLIESKNAQLAKQINESKVVVTESKIPAKQPTKLPARRTANAPTAQTIAEGKNNQSQQGYTSYTPDQIAEMI